VICCSAICFICNYITTGYCHVNYFPEKFFVLTIILLRLLPNLGRL